MQAATKTASRTVPQIVNQRVLLIMKHGGHRLSTGGQQHGGNIDGPAMRHQKSRYPLFTRLLNDLPAVPMGMTQQALRAA